MKLAILQVADQGPLESLVVMLRSVGYRCAIPNAALRDQLRRIGCDTVLAPSDLVRQFGYEMPFAIDEATPRDMIRADLYIDIKAHRAYPKIIDQWPNLTNRVLWYRINGGRPEHVVNARGDHGDEVSPPCPVLTPNQWYREGYGDDTAYCYWPPFVRFDDYGPRVECGYALPICLIHNLTGWGYGALVEPMQTLGVRMYGNGSPSGLIPHARVKTLLRGALAYVHLKSSDAPGYALYEAMASGCPVICTRRLIWRCRMHDLLIPGETCLVFDRETHDGLTLEDVTECTREVSTHLQTLANFDINQRIGEAGRNRLKSIMWSESKPEDVQSLSLFMERNFK